MLIRTARTVQGITLRIVATALLLAPLALYVYAAQIEFLRGQAPEFVIVNFVAFAVLAYLLTRWVSRWRCVLMVPGMFVAAFAIEVLFVIYTGHGNPMAFNSARFIVAVLGTLLGALWSKYPAQLSYTQRRRSL
jgi:hypothetical protein